MEENDPHEKELISKGFDGLMPSPDLKIFSDDPENLSEGSICKLLNNIQVTFALRGESLVTSCTDHITVSEKPSYSVTVNGKDYEVYDNPQPYNWFYAVDAVVKITDALLEKQGNKNRMYFSASGDNSIDFLLLTPEQYNYLHEHRIGGGFGPIVKTSAEMK
jgi:hypothetical protein